MVVETAGGDESGSVVVSIALGMSSRGTGSRVIGPALDVPEATRQTR